MTLTQEEAFSLLNRQEWRLANLYKIKDKEGNVVDFEPNWAQKSLLSSHNLNIVLKARQLGITTFHAFSLYTKPFAQGLKKCLYFLKPQNTLTSLYLSRHFLSLKHSLDVATKGRTKASNPRCLMGC